MPDPLARVSEVSPRASAVPSRRPEAHVCALYLHVPFCASKCLYCDFASWATRADDPLVAAYVASLVEQVRAVSFAGLLDGCVTGYVGGGTPSLLGSRLANVVRTVVEAAHPSELTCEANPDSLDDDLLCRLVSSGATRLSIGVQSTNDEELRLLGRRHTAEEALSRVGAAVASGLSVSCDLMCAIPGQSEGSWRKSLADVVAAGARHVSAYPLAIEEGTAFERLYANDPCAFNDEDVEAERMERAEEILLREGFARYEVASYARPGHRCAHNLAYWSGLPYLGLGSAAASMLSRDGYGRLRTLCPQLPSLEPDIERVRMTVASSRAEIASDARLASLRFDMELLDGAQAAAEDLMLSARLSDGISPSLLAHARDVIGSRVDEVVESVIGAGLARECGGSVRPTHDGWLLGNELYGAFWSLASGEVATLSV